MRVSVDLLDFFRPRIQTLSPQEKREYSQLEVEERETGPVTPLVAGENRLIPVVGLACKKG